MVWVTFSLWLYSEHLGCYEAKGTFYSVIYVLIGREDGLCSSPDLLWAQFMQSADILLHVHMMEYSVDFYQAQPVKLNQKGNRRWINPTGVLLKNMTPSEVMDISFYHSISSHVRKILMNLKCLVCQLVSHESRSQTTNLISDLWLFMKPSASKSRCTEDMPSFRLTPALCVRGA